MDIILRKYNYNLETGTVGTDDENIANILYNINRMEMNVPYLYSDADDFGEDLGQLFFMIADIRVHLNEFFKIFGDKIEVATLAAVNSVSDEVLRIVKKALADYDVISEKEETILEDESEKMIFVFPEVYKKLLAIVPSILALDAQAVGKV